VDAAAVVQDVRDSDLRRVRDLREELVERVRQLQLPFLDELEDHHGGVRLGDGGDPVFRLGGQRPLVVSIDIAVAERPVVQDLALLRENQAPHPLVLLDQPVE
jgi:hypothetical protein